MAGQVTAPTAASVYTTPHALPQSSNSAAPYSLPPSDRLSLSSSSGSTAVTLPRGKVDELLVESTDQSTDFSDDGGSTACFDSAFSFFLDRSAQEWPQEPSVDSSPLSQLQSAQIQRDPEAECAGAFEEFISYGDSGSAENAKRCDYSFR